MVVVPRESPGGTVAFKVGLGVRQILGILGGLVQFHGSHAEFVFVASGSVLMQREKTKIPFLYFVSTVDLSLLLKPLEKC